MGTNLQDVYYCNLNRVEELNNRLNNRLLPSNQLETQYFNRPARTRQVIFPMIDNRKQTRVQRLNAPTYNNQKMFTPGNLAPYSGYSIDADTRLKNIPIPLQKCSQSTYVPNANSDLYMNSYLVDKHVVKMNNPHGLLQKEEVFSEKNANRCNLGNDIFNNHIRQQIKSIGM